MKLEPETIEEVEGYMDEHNIETRSEGMRQLINAGLSEPTPGELLIGIAKIAVTAGAFGVGLAVVGEVSFRTGTGFFLMAVSGFITLFAFLFTAYRCNRTDNQETA